MLAHNDLVGGERDQCAARHGIVRHERSDLAFMFEYRARDLGRCQDQPSGGVEHQIQWNFRIRQMNRTEDLFTVVDVDVAKQRKTQEAHCLLSMYQQDNSRFALPLN